MEILLCLALASAKVHQAETHRKGVQACKILRRVLLMASVSTVSGSVCEQIERESVTVKLPTFFLKKSVSACDTLTSYGLSMVMSCEQFDHRVNFPS